VNKLLVVLGLVLTLGCASQIPAKAGGAHYFKELAAEGYRWVTVNGPYACATEQELRDVVSNPTDATELHMVADLGAYYLIPGTLVQVLQNDRANGMSEILMGGITRPLWTYTKFLTARPIKDTYGIVETPATSGLIVRADARIIHTPPEQLTPIPPAIPVPVPTPITPESNAGVSR
jgi:hypothetical protein